MHANLTTTSRRRLLLAALILLLALVTTAVATASWSQPDQTAAATERGARRADATTTTTSGEDQAAAPATDGAPAGADSESEDPSGGETPDDDMPDVPEDDDEDPGPWYPPNHGIDDFAPNPLVLDLVSPVDPELGPGGQQQLGGSFSGGPVQCDGKCIDSATVEPGGTTATFELRTTVPARLWVVLDSPAVQDTGSLVTDWEVTFDDLTPDTLYNVTLVAEDQNGNLDHRYGQFRTLERRVTVTFTSIDVVNDADKWDVNKGEIEWFFEVDGDWIESFHRGVAKIKGGRSIHLGDDRRMVIDDADRYLELAVQGVEHDGGWCPAGIPPYADHFGGDIADCRDVATAVATLDLDDLVVDDPALPVGYDAAFMLRTRDHYLQFDVYGTIDIDYV